MSSSSNCSTTRKPTFTASLQLEETIYPYRWRPGEKKELFKMDITDEEAANRLVENMEHMLQTALFADVKLIVEGREFAAHRAMLSARSPVFASLFEGQGPVSSVPVTDIKKGTFEQLLYYIYTGRIKSLEKYAVDLYIAAGKYQLTELKRICDDWLTTHLSTETVASILALADEHSAPKLKSRALAFLIDNASTVMSTEAWQQLVTSRADLVAEVALVLAKKLDEVQKDLPRENMSRRHKHPRFY